MRLWARTVFPSGALPGNTLVERWHPRGLARCGSTRQNRAPNGAEHGRGNSLGSARSGRTELCFATFLALLLTSGGAALAQTLPDAPQPQTIQSSSQQQNPEPSKSPENPAEKMTVEAAKATIHMGEAAMVKARNWESSWVTGVYIEKNRTMLPLTLEERRQLYMSQTLVTPGAYLKRKRSIVREARTIRFRRSASMPSSGCWRGTRCPKGLSRV